MFAIRRAAEGWEPRRLLFFWNVVITRSPPTVAFTTRSQIAERSLREIGAEHPGEVTSSGLLGRPGRLVIPGC